MDHLSIVSDGVAYELVLDALTHDGAADVARMPADICARDPMPGSSQPPPGFDLADWREGELTDHEPCLKPYAR